MDTLRVAQKAMININSDLIKVCCRCNIESPRTKEHFYADKKSKDGLQARCKSCSEYNRQPRPPKEENGLFRCCRCKQYLSSDLFSMIKNKPGDYCLDCKRANGIERARKLGVKPKLVSRCVDGQKECLKCEQFKDLSEFYFFPSEPGPSTYCKECCKTRSSRNREYREGGKYFRSRSKLSPEDRKVRQKEARDRWNAKRKEESKLIVAPEEKTCPRCDRLLISAMFKKRSYNIDGLSTFCSMCEYSATRQSEAVRKTDRWWIYMYASISRRAKDKGDEFDITKDFLQELFESQQGRCYWFGVPLIPTGEKRHPQKPSLDRLDCSKGYTRGNVVLTSHAANMGRNCSTVEQFEDFVAVLKSTFKQS